jgi:hypothetical protein
VLTKADIEKYFIAEKQLGFVGLSIAGALIITAFIFFFYLKTNFYKGASIPLLLIGLLLLIAGAAIFGRSDKDRIRNVYAFDMNPSELKEKELPRMQKVMKNFTIFRPVEIVLTLIGIGLFIYFRNNEAQYFWKGLGLTLAIMALFIFIIDTTADKRGKAYTEGLESWLSKN